MTITVKEHEWMDVGAWVWRNFDKVSGISFLPHTDHSYRQAPYQDCTEEEYQELLEKMPDSVDWSELETYEVEDNTKERKLLLVPAMLAKSSISQHKVLDNN